MADAPRQRLQRISQAADDVAQIVARMREFYRRDLDPDQLEKVNVNKAIEEVIELTRPRWRDLAQRQGISIHIKFELESNPPALVCNASELREALTNVVFNAVDALPQGGVITLVTRSVTRPGSQEDGRAEQELQIEVRDNGVGMDEKVRQHCLEPFFSTKHPKRRHRPGTGHGLWNGQAARRQPLRLRARPITAPVCVLFSPSGSGPLPPPGPRPAPPEPCRSLRILCIDDEPELRQLMHDVLEVHHHKVTVASGGREGLEMFRSNLRGREPYEMVITDLGMPDMDGHHVARAIKAESPRTPVIMLTGWGTMMQAEGESAPEVDAVLSKPPRIQELNDLLYRICAKSAKG